MLSITEQEQLTAIVYGDTFALYDEKSFDEFVAPLRHRLTANGISLDLFRGKRCLDAGCGGGRGSILMAESGAAEVVGVDLSATNVESCRKRAAQKRLPNVTFHQQSLADLTFADESFDVVWCNGVLHHMVDPDRGLKEISRVLKRGGALWLYLYGSGGIYWFVIDWIRNALQGVDVRECIAHLRLMDVPVRRIAEWIDDWFTPYLRRYTRADVTRRLDELGFVQTSPLDRGVHYDTSERRITADLRELQLMGEGDVRVLCRRAGDSSGNRFALPDPPDGRGSRFEDSDAVTQFAAPLQRIADALTAIDTSGRDSAGIYKILACRSIHSNVRSLLEQEQPFDESALHRHLSGVATFLAELAQ